MMPWPWSFLLEGDVGLYQPNRQTNCVNVLHNELPLFFFAFQKCKRLPLWLIPAFVSFF